MKPGKRGPWTVGLLCGLVTATAGAQAGGATNATTLDQVQVTATRFREPIQEVPESIEQISGEELRARGVNDLRTALALLGGVTVAPGGDEGPAGAVPGLLGTREADDFLLVVDGVPAGGAFIPQFSTLNLNNVERIEVQRGPASVFYGTTAFAGTINIIHYAAGRAERQASVAYGSFGSVNAAGSAVLSDGAVRQSVAVDGSRDRYSDPRAGADRAHGLYRLGGDLLGGAARLDLDATVQHQRPGSPRPLIDGRLDSVPLDFNQNPSDGKIDTQRYQLNAGFDRRLSLGDWGSTLALTQTHVQRVQGFFSEAEDSGDDPADGTLGGNGGDDPFDQVICRLPGGNRLSADCADAVDTLAGGTGTGYHQKQHLTEVFFDTHLTHRFAPSLIATVGVNELYGLAHQRSEVFDYLIPADGTPPQASGEGTPVDRSTFSDSRNFAGAYAQTRWTPLKGIGLLGGLRFNRIDERRTSADSDDGARTQRAGTSRLSGSLGVNARVWLDPEADLDDVTTYFSFANTFQPPQIDFGPDDQGQPLLRPESERSYQLGIKADGFDGRFAADLAAFVVDFSNQAVTTQINDTPALVNGGQERFSGVELELAYKLLRSLSMTANASYNDARYRRFTTQIDGAATVLDGNRIPLSPPVLAGAGLIYAPFEGLHGAITGNFVGRRPLDMQNTVTAAAYATLDATLGYRFRGVDLSVSGYNLSDRRDPVLQSELGEGQYYVLPGRRLFVRLSAPI